MVITPMAVMVQLTPHMATIPMAMARMTMIRER
jgi:hypothetical protein